MRKLVDSSLKIKTDFNKLRPKGIFSIAFGLFFLIISSIFDLFMIYFLINYCLFMTFRCC